jgi:hypothetical protein
MRKYALDTEVKYMGKVVTVWDYNERYNIYTLKTAEGKRIYDVKEENIEGAK